MSDQPPSQPGVDDAPAGDTPPAVPSIDLSKPEEPAPSSPGDAGPLLSAPDAEPAPPVPVADPPPVGADTPPAPPPSPASSPPAATPTTEADPAPSGAPKSQALKMVALVLVFVAVIAVAFLLGKKDGGNEDPIASSTTTTVDDTPVNTSKWETFTDDEAGFSIKHPDDWLRVPVEGAERLFLRAGPATAGQVTVRNITSANAPAVIQNLIEDTDLVDDATEFQLSGLPAVVFIFRTPIDEDSPDPGIAVQYFVIAPNKLYSIVFVTRPPEELNRLGRIFNAVSASFKVTNDNPAPEPPTTTTTAG